MSKRRVKFVSLTDDSDEGPRVERLPGDTRWGGEDVHLGRVEGHDGQALWLTCQADGAIPNGTMVQKQSGHPEDHHSDGAVGCVVGSVRAGGVLGYFVKWPDFPVPTGVMALTEDGEEKLRVVGWGIEASTPCQS